jgi:hypothetical protein
MKRKLKHLSADLRITAEAYLALAGSTQQGQYVLQPDGTYTKEMKNVVGIKKAWDKAQKFVLVLDAYLERPHYLDNRQGLTVKQTEAKKFAFGFDNPAIKELEWQRKTKLNFKHLTLYGTRKSEK